MIRAWCFLLGFAGLVAALPARAQTQSWPTRFVRLVVPGGSGTAADVSARIIAQALSERWGQQVVVENRPGAGGNLGADAVARAAPDGMTIVMGAVATHAINPWLYARLPYDPVRDFTPITGVARVPNVLVMNVDTARRLGIGSVRDLVAHAQRNPGRLNVGSGGNGSAGHLAAEMFKSQAGVFMVHIPYAGGNAAQLALLSGQVDLNFDNLAAASANIRAGKLRALAVTTRQRAAAMPEVPAVAEAGGALARFDIDTWFGLFGPARLPAETTQRLNRAFVDALATPELKARLGSLMAEPIAGTPEQFGEFVKRELAKYEGVVKASGARIE